LKKKEDRRKPGREKKKNNKPFNRNKLDCIKSKNFSEKKRKNCERNNKKMLHRKK